MGPVGQGQHKKSPHFFRQKIVLETDKVPQYAYRLLISNFFLSPILDIFLLFLFSVRLDPDGEL